MPSPPERTMLRHDVPPWVEDGALYFLTVCTRPRGQNQLCVPGIGEPIIKSAAWYHETGRWWLRMLLLMPDHLHAILSFPPHEALPELVKGWKSYQARTRRIVWQDGFFDHRLRNEESLDEFSSYIAMNPVRAGLVTDHRHWKYRWPPPPP